MTHEYTITGMTCGGCEAKVKSNLFKVPGILSVNVSKEKNAATIEMDKHVALGTLQQALGGETSKYKISATHHQEHTEQVKSWLSTYKPVLLIFAYLLGTTAIIQSTTGGWHWMPWMSHFMGSFFLVFSFFKLLNLKAFAESYAMYDVVAKQWAPWGYVYAFIELALGVTYITGSAPLVVNSITFLVMSISMVGVLQSVISKRAIRCACLGTVFNLPVSTITIIEDALMIVMSLAMLINAL